MTEFFAFGWPWQIYSTFKVKQFVYEPIHYLVLLSNVISALFIIWFFFLWPFFGPKWHIFKILNKCGDLCLELNPGKICVHSDSVISHGWASPSSALPYIWHSLYSPSLSLLLSGSTLESLWYLTIWLQFCFWHLSNFPKIQFFLVLRVFYLCDMDTACVHDKNL